MNSFKKQLILVYLFIAIALCCCSNNNVAAATDSSNESEDDGENLKGTANKLVAQAREQYEALPDHGKFASGAVIGFGTSRLAVKSVEKIVKIGGAAFVA